MCPKCHSLMAIISDNCWCRMLACLDCNCLVLERRARWYGEDVTEQTVFTGETIRIPVK